MEMSMEKWNKLKTPPKWALKEIQAGRLRGKTDINPQWRYQAMTEVYGECGTGWKYEITKLWTEQGDKGQVFAFAMVAVQVKTGEEWSAPIPACGGSMLVEMESKGLYCNDEGFKMAITDALGTALKMLGVAADIYQGGNHDTKYQKPQEQIKTPVVQMKPEAPAQWITLTPPYFMEPREGSNGAKYVVVKTDKGESYFSFHNTVMDALDKANGPLECRIDNKQTKYGFSIEEVRGSL